MKSNFVSHTGFAPIETRAAERETFTEMHVTLSLERPGSHRASAQEMFEALASVLVERRIQPIAEKIYGLSAGKDEVLRQRDGVYRLRGLDRTMPVAWIQGTPVRGGEIAGVQVWGVVPHDGQICVRTVDCPVTGRARLWTGDGFRMLHLPAVRGTHPDGTLPAGRPAQAGQMFANVAAGLASHGMTYPDVVRTWIYVAQLLEWYGDMNRVRTEIYRQAGLGVAGGAPFPASTGIMGHSAYEECIMDALAVQASRPGAIATAAITRSAKQNASFNYGSSFSRGMALTIEGRRTVHISGTASINAAGQSTHVGDAEHQTLDTLLSIAAILDEQGGGLRDIASATLFCKDRSAWEAWEQTTRLLQMPAIPQIAVYADVCRPDLLVEMEAVAVI